MSLFGKKSERKPSGTLVLYTTKLGATRRYAEPMDARDFLDEVDIASIIPAVRFGKEEE